MEAATSVTGNRPADLDPRGSEEVALALSNSDAKKRLNAFKALQPLMQAVIADPGTGATPQDKAVAVGKLLESAHAHLPEVALLVGAESPWSIAMVAGVVNTMARNAWRDRQTADIGESVAVLKEVAASRSFLTFSQEIGALDWNHQTNDPLDGITAMRISALNASHKFIDCVRRFDFLQEDKSGLISKLLALSHKLAFSVEEEVRNMSPHIAINWRRSLLDRASAIVASEYDRIADHNKKVLDGMQSRNETAKFESFKSKMRNDIDAVLGVVEKYAQMSFSTLLSASTAYMDMLSKFDPDGNKVSESPSTKGA